MSNEKIREMVSDAYTKAIKQSGGCCGSTPAGSVAKLASAEARIMSLPSSDSSSLPFGFST